MFIKDNIRWERQYDLERDNLESIWIEVFIKNSKSLLLATCYRPRNQNIYRLITMKILMICYADVHKSLKKQLSWETSM